MSFLTRFPTPATQTRGDMATLWKGANDRAAQGDGSHGSVFEMDFHVLPSGIVTVTALNSATAEGFDKIAGQYGIASLVATTGADHRGAQVEFDTVGSFLNDANGELIVQFDVNLFRCSTFFLGLFETGATVFDASSALPTNIDFMGFYRLNGGAVNFVSNFDAGTDVTDTVEVLASDYYHAEAAGESEPTRLGFAVSNDKLRRLVVDDVAYKAAVDAYTNTALPSTSINLLPVIAIARGASQDETDVRLDVDRIKIYQGP